ncbi:Uncharacterised protein family UPF0102 [Citrobacter braakii]|nr:Uncharacterised protein family UPF0102 [Citrobacter braakii]
MAQIPARTSRPRQLTSKQTGDAWESTARDWLQSKGLHFIAANVHERGGEIDLIMREGNTTVFVEVRYRRSAQFGGCSGECDPEQTTQIITDCPLVACAPQWKF